MFGRGISLAFVILQLSTLAKLEDPNPGGCNGLEGANKFLMADNGKMLARCNQCGPTFDNIDSVGVHGQLTDKYAQWIFEPVGDKCAIKSNDSGLYIGRCNSCWKDATHPDAVFNNIAKASTALPHSLWTVHKHGAGFYSFEADTGNYMARCNQCVHGGTQADYAFVHAANPIGSALWTVVRKYY